MWRTRRVTRPSCFYWRSTSTLTSRGIACRPWWTATRLTWMARIERGTAWRIWQGKDKVDELWPQNKCCRWQRIDVNWIVYIMIIRGLNFQWHTWASANLGSSQAEERGGEEKVGNFILKRFTEFLPCTPNVLVTNYLSQVATRAAEAGVESVAWRALRPRLSTLCPARRPPCRHEQCMAGAQRGLVDLPWWAVGQGLCSVWFP